MKNFLRIHLPIILVLGFSVYGARAATRDVLNASEVVEASPQDLSKDITVLYPPEHTVVNPLGRERVGLSRFAEDPLAVLQSGTSTLRIVVDKAWACGTASTTKTIGFAAPFVSVTNDGSVTGFIDWGLTVATTADYPINAGETFTLPIPVNSTQFVSCITASSSTTMRFLAAR